uniref:Uncharacterized protein n=1 Tax=Fagus sylvatica TaxID=28930 RepID=A0A2N9HW35_FAGSY
MEDMALAETHTTPHHPRPRPPPHPNTRNQDPQKHPSKPPTPRPRPSPSSRRHHPQPPPARADRHKHLKIGNPTTPRPRPSTQDKTEPPRDPRRSSSTASLTPYSPPPRDPGRDHHREPDAVNTRSTHAQKPKPTSSKPKRTEKNNLLAEKRGVHDVFNYVCAGSATNVAEYGLTGKKSEPQEFDVLTDS